ncbi:MAG TPA: adenylate/guanylate cyclase domain-containing protein [Gemmatimonadota bacterium]|nr:adenylate/guanylate cyclase domain-containing protein [Gemmatimonadota bacterium]
MTRQVRIHPVTLRFDDAALEARFREQYRASATRQVRVTLLVGSALFVAFIFVDRWADPDLALRAWRVRAAVAAVFLVSFGLTFAPFWPRVRGRVLWAAALVGGIGMCALIAIGGPWVELRWVGLVLVVLGAATLLRLAFPAVVLLSAVFFAAWPVTLSVAGELTLDRTLGGWIALGSAYVIGLLAAYTIERYARSGFLYEREAAHERERSERLLLNILPAPIAERLKESEGPIADHHAEATILFADIAGFTAMSTRMPADELVTMLNAVFTGFDQLARRHGVEKIKTIGDAYMAVAGLPEAVADHVERIADLALDMLAHSSLAIRIGIDTGPVVAGVIGESKFIYDLWGDAVTTASRMESHGVPGGIQVTEAVRNRLADRYDLVERGEIEVKGRGTMRTWLLEGRRDGAKGAAAP